MSVCTALHLFLSILLCSSAGFDKRAANLLREAKRILVYQSVLKTKTAEAFLAFLQSLQQQSEDKIIADYSRFYQELSKTSCASWRAFVAEEVSFLGYSDYVQSCPCIPLGQHRKLLFPDSMYGRFDRFQAALASFTNCT